MQISYKLEATQKQLRKWRIELLSQKTWIAIGWGQSLIIFYIVLPHMFLGKILGFSRSVVPVLPKQLQKQLRFNLYATSIQVRWNLVASYMILRCNLDPTLIRVRWNLDASYLKLRCKLGKGPKKNYESLDICPNWFHPTNLEAQYGQKSLDK